jgi:uncharacterized protein YjeT (DUF2065 family)
MEIEKTVWIIINLVLIIYGIVLFVCGKYIRKKDSINFVKFY